MVNNNSLFSTTTMMRPALRVAALIIAAHGACVGPRTASEMAALFAAPYESVDRPTVALNRTDADPDPETVSLQLQVLKIRSIHEKDQTLVVHAFFRRSWSDPRLAWAAGDEAPCVDEFDFPISTQGKIWSPDVYVENTAERDVEFSAGALFVRSDGSVRSSVQVLFSLTCATGQHKREIPNFKGSYLGRFPLVSADFWTSDHLSERSRSVDAFHGTRARGTLTLKRR